MKGGSSLPLVFIVYKHRKVIYDFKTKTSETVGETMPH